ncbi:MAG: hypothetical protein AB1505_05455 [Candidatus Latescibacterota bacterium]
MLDGVLGLLEEVLPARGWELHWHSRGVGASYRGKGRLHLHIGRRWIDVRVGTPRLVDAAGTTRRMVMWSRRHRVRVESAADLAGGARPQLEALLAQAEELLEGAGART